MRSLPKLGKLGMVLVVAAAAAGLAGTAYAVNSAKAKHHATAAGTKSAKPSKKAAATAPYPGPPITVSSTLPPDLPNQGGAPAATIYDAASFAWQEFIALNWPAVDQTGQPNTRGMPNTSQNFGTDTPSQPVVWETYRSKVETFPGVGDPPGYDQHQDGSDDYGYDALPQYTYGARSTTPADPQPGQSYVQNNPGGSALDVPPCPGQTPPAQPAWVNLDEITQIGDDSMFAGSLPTASSSANVQPQLIRFLAKGNREFYDYVAGQTFWYQGQQYMNAVNAFENSLTTNIPAADGTVIDLPTGTVLVKAAWRELTAAEMSEVQNGNAPFLTKTVRYYEANPATNNPDKAPTVPPACYYEKTWALIALHIIHKTASAPYLVFATFEYTGNILNTNGTPVEDNNGKVVNAPSGGPTDPSEQYTDINGTTYSPQYPSGNPATTPSMPQKPVTTLKSPIAQAGTPSCDVGPGESQPNSQIYYRDLLYGPLPDNDAAGSAPPVCVNQRYFSIPTEIQQANAAAHAALSGYGAPNLWQNYKLVNVQWQPFDIAYIDTTGSNTARLASTFNLSNSVVETDNVLQQFFGSLQYGITNEIFTKSAFELNAQPVEPVPPPTPPIQQTSFSIAPSTVDPNGTAYDVYLPISQPAGSSQPFATKVTMGGCMGCHGRAERGGTDFSFTLAGGPVAQPEFPAAALSATALNTVVHPNLKGLDRERLNNLRRALEGH